MDVVAKQLDYYTIEDIYNLPEGQRAEFLSDKVKAGIYEDFEIDFTEISIE